jgi:hypothetical protein
VLGGDEHRREEEPQEVRRACTAHLLYAVQSPTGLLALLRRRPPSSTTPAASSTQARFFAGRLRAPEGRGWKVGGGAAGGVGGATIFGSLPAERLQLAGFPGASSRNSFWETVWYRFGSRRPRSWS